jgi:psp operon transcriptional activator
MEALGESEVFLDFQERLSRVAQVDRPVLIVGERGTGKELAVSRLHYLSRRWQGPLVALNCAALSPSVLESELFGHEAGAFTGAVKKRPGRFEAADNGSLFLDEIGLIPVTVQEKILRVVEYNQFERVGGSHPVRVDVRIIGATNVDLPKLAEEGKFKRDLLDRLSFEVLFLPPLRQRREDIGLLACKFAARMAMELGWREVPEFDEDAMEALETYNWPGNIRELKNVVERAVYASAGGAIRSVVFDPFISPFGELEDGPVSGQAAAASGDLPRFIPGKTPLNDMVRELEVTALKTALETAKFHQGEAANLLGLSYHQFRGLYRKHKDSVED